jgi:hypothetical protein
VRRDSVNGAVLVIASWSCCGELGWAAVSPSPEASEVRAPYGRLPRPEKLAAVSTLFKHLLKKHFKSFKAYSFDSKMINGGDKSQRQQFKITKRKISIVRLRLAHLVANHGLTSNWRGLGDTYKKMRRNDFPASPNEALWLLIAGDATSYNRSCCLRQQRFTSSHFQI